MAKWHVMTTYENGRGSTNVEADSPPVYDKTSNIWSFSNAGKVVLQAPRENVLYIKVLED